MKRILLVSALSFCLCGCGFTQDSRQIPYLRASVTTVADSICVMVKPEDDEKFDTLRISEIGSENNKLEKYDLADVPVSPDKCVPNLDYRFEVGKSYNVAVILVSPDKYKKGLQPSARIFRTSFTIIEKNGKWAVSSAN
ncbi:putative T6SS immunity periplasmic lipoprotein [Enterobacillus tribolii]|uniref:putative T6SS immunity periplasmic lipoprotein n=1 Tax=Enterobacillus tribolii TaxID=1487935 RepID=UPI000E1C4779|nr:putative T6SS immunity periplasmic lipoprotein [Enterobacillus tribolii]MBW7981923.1 hypothetical protein [Enterobacillus tribolii]